MSRTSTPPPRAARKKRQRPQPAENAGSPSNPVVSLMHAHNMWMTADLRAWFVIAYLSAAVEDPGDLEEAARRLGIHPRRMLEWARAGRRFSSQECVWRFGWRDGDGLPLPVSCIPLLTPLSPRARQELLEAMRGEGVSVVKIRNRLRSRRNVNR